MVQAARCWRVCVARCFECIRSIVKCVDLIHFGAQRMCRRCCDAGGSHGVACVGQILRQRWRRFRRRGLKASRAKAASQGISAGTIGKTLGGISYDRNVIRLDRSQKSFKLSFEQFYARRVSPQLISRGRSMMAQASRHARPHGKALRRAGRNRDRDLGSGDQLWLGSRPGHFDRPVACNARPTIAAVRRSLSRS